MTILFFARRFYPEIGGVEKHIAEISKVLWARGHKVVIICEKPRRTSAGKPPNYHSVAQSDTYYINPKSGVKSIQSEILKSNKICVVQLNFGKSDFFKKFRIWQKIYQIRSLVRLSDVVHCHDVFFWYLPLRFLFFKRQVFTTFHGYEGFPIAKKNILIRKLSETLSTGNICVGKFMKKWYGTRATKIIYGATDESYNKTKKFNKIHPIALFYGRLDDQTGVVEYEEATRLIKAKYPEFRLDIYGEGKYRKKVENLVKRGFVTNVNEILPKYRFAFLSRYLSMLEAMAAGRLVFALYDNPLKRDYLEATPFKKWIVICGSAQELAEKLDFYIQNPKIEAEMVKNAKNWVKDKTWENLADTYLKLWKKS